MKKTLLFGATTLICVLTFSQARAIPPTWHAEGHHNPSHESHNEGMSGEHGSPHHGHGMMAIPDGQPVPSVKSIVHTDPMQGWNLELQVENFQFAPEHLDQPSTTTEGHAHIYVNGIKIARLYGNWYHLPELPPGVNEVTVSLNTNGHETLMFNGEPIQDTVTIEVQP
ncbi:MAG: hypothetical protein WBG66_23145 [Geitlerinemataceae cyanobacterium]